MRCRRLGGEADVSVRRRGEELVSTGHDVFACKARRRAITISCISIAPFSAHMHEQEMTAMDARRLRACLAILGLCHRL